MSIRKPAVAGQFYPSSASGLKSQIEQLIDRAAVKKKAIACVLPHAGYMYSGAVAAKTVSGIQLTDKVILVGPNHTGFGVAFSVMAEGIWQTPLGQVKIDAQLAGKLLKQSKYLEADNLAHEYEHSLEVELPFLQYFHPGFQMVPIIVSGSRPEILAQVGRDIAAVIRDNKLLDSVLIIASSDMTHYEPQAQAQEKDRRAIDAILELDEAELLKRVSAYGISMCGWAPVAVMLSAAKSLGATRATLVHYQTSGDVSKDYGSVVGYAGIILQ